MTLEPIRRFARKYLGYKSSLYRLAARALSDGTIIKREGFGTYRQLSRLRRNSENRTKLPPTLVQFRSIEHPLMLRPGTDDVGAVINNIVRREYGHVEPKKMPRVLVDAGAYIGDTSIYFLNRYPALRSIALEPNPKSRAMAEVNLAPYRNRVELIPAALSTAVGVVSFGGNEMGAQISEGGTFEVQTVSLSALMEQIPEGYIDILKMDIEGSEMDILSADVKPWIANVGLLIIETHGPDIERKLLNVMRKNSWTATRYRNLFYCQPAV